MNSNERAQHEWFDQELDRLLTGYPEAVEGEDELVQAAVLMQRFDLNQQSEPDDRFIRDLEKQLMPAFNLKVTRPKENKQPLQRIFDQAGMRLRAERKQHRGVSFFASALSLGLLFAVIAATTFVAINGGDEQGTGGLPAVLTAPNSAESSPTSSGVNTASESVSVAPTPTIASTAASSSVSEANSSNGLSEIWRSDPPTEGLTISTRIAVADGILYRVLTSQSGNDSEIQALNALDGTEVWRAGDLDSIRAISAESQGAYIANVDENGISTVVALDAESGSIRWTAPISDQVVTMALQAPADGSGEALILTKDAANNVTAVDVSTGDIVWQTSIGIQTAPSGIGIVPIVSNGEFVVAQTTSGSFYGLDFKTGDVLWMLDTVAAYRVAVAADTLGVVVDLPNSGGQRALVGFGMRDGSKLWERSIDASDTGGDELGVSGDAFVITGRGLSEVSEFNLGTPTSSNGPRFAATNDVLDPDPDIALAFGIDPATGQTMWATDWSSHDAIQTPSAESGLTSSAYGVASLDVSGGDSVPILLTVDGFIGPLTPNSLNGIPLLSMGFTGQSIANPIEMRFDLREIDTDGSSIFLELGDGTIVAYEFDAATS